MSNKGFALVTMLMVVSVVGILTAGSLILSVTNLRLTRNDVTASQAMGVAQAGSAYWRAELVSLYMHMVENFDDYQDDIDAYNENNPSDPIACGNFFAIGVDIDRDGTPDVGRGEALPSIDVPVGGQVGKAVVTFTTRGSAIVLDSRGTVSGARGRMVDEFRVSALDMWNNAVFAGNSAANATIQGRAEIRGSVHVLGLGLTSADKALDLNGAFALGNTYRSINSSIDPTTVDNPMRLTTRDPTDLCATLRVKRGYVYMGGSAQIGFNESSNAEPFIDPLRGIFTNDGIRNGILDTNVFSNNGMSAAYDAGNTFRFPFLDDTNSDTGQTWRHGLNQNGLILSLDPAQDDRNKYQPDREGVAADGETYLTNSCFDIHNGGKGLFGVDEAGVITIDTKKANGTGQSATGFALNYGATPSFHCAKRVKNGIQPGVDETLAEVSWDKGTNELYVGGTSGVLAFRGANLLLTGPNSSGTVQIAYLGEGIFFTEDAGGSAGGAGGSVELEFDFIPAAGNAPLTDAGKGMQKDPNNPFRVQRHSTRKNTYPATSVLALVADKNVVSGGAQMRFTVAIFAEELVYVTKQTLVAGSIVTRSFHAGSQVPTVLYVPNLAERLSDLLPGTSSKAFAVSNVAFSRR